MLPKFILFLVFTVSIIAACAQLVHPDPFQYNGDYRCKMEFNQAEILEHKIKKVEAWYMIFKNDGITPMDSFPQYTLTFNERGLPDYFEYGRHEPLRNWAKFKRKMGWRADTTRVFYMNFIYDQKDQLIHIKEIIPSRFSENYDRNDVCFFYDKNSSLISQRIEEKRIYTEGYEYHGTSYSNDTSLVSIEIKHDGNLVDSIFRSSQDWNRYTFNKRSDTLIAKCSMDSIFLKFRNPRGPELDSLGRIKSYTSFAKWISLSSGGTVPSPSTKDVFYTYKYNDCGKLREIERKNRGGHQLPSKIFTYDENGLLQNIRYEGQVNGTYYRYFY